MIACRPADAIDRPFIVNGWGESFRFANTAGLISMLDWWDIMPAQISRLLDREGMRTIVAYETEERNRKYDLYGFLTYDPDPEPPWRELPLVSYCYVRLSQRRWGVARTMFEAAGIDPKAPFFYACSTPSESELRRARKIPAARWRPLLARYPRGQDPARSER